MPELIHSTPTPNPLPPSLYAAPPPVHRSPRRRPLRHPRPPQAPPSTTGSATKASARPS
jgi:hypothetical protein